MARREHSVGPAPLCMTFECRHSDLPQACRITFAATGRLNNAGCNAGVNNGGLCGAAEPWTAVLKASPIWRFTSPLKEPSSGLMNGRIDATPLPLSRDL
jgi:hypothetical protein